MQLTCTVGVSQSSAGMSLGFGGFSRAIWAPWLYWK